MLKQVMDLEIDAAVKREILAQGLLKFLTRELEQDAEAIEEDLEGSLEDDSKEDFQEGLDLDQGLEDFDSIGWQGPNCFSGCL